MIPGAFFIQLEAVDDLDEKRQLRQAMKEKIRRIPETTRMALNANIASRLFSLPEWKSAGTIGVTLSTAGEIDTETTIQKAWAEQKRVAVPKADMKMKTMDFRVIQAFNDVEKAYAGIREPIEERTEGVPPGEIDLLIVPGLAFDENGYRIGFGGGFYDRFLADYRNVTASLAYECQLIEHIPAQSFDRPVGVIITEQRAIRTGKRR